MRLSSAFVAIPAVLAFCGVAVAAPLEPRGADSCTTAGAMICNADLTQFALCNPPAAPVWQAVAPGTTCTPSGGAAGAGDAPVELPGQPPIEPALASEVVVIPTAPPAVPTPPVVAPAAPSDVKSPASTAPSVTPGNIPATPGVADQSTILSSNFGGAGSKPFYGSKAKGKKRKVAYWQLSDGVKAGESNYDYASLDGLTHLILFSITMNDTAPVLDLAVERVWPADVISKVRAQDTAVMAAFGGWAMDELYKSLANAEQAKALGVRIADFAIANELDGIDIDHEYVLSTQMAWWPELVHAIRARCVEKSVPDMIISMALPAVPANMYEKSTAPVVEQVLEAYKKSFFDKLGDSIDFYNLMTYDMLNRYDKGKETKHQASLPGTLATIEYYEGEGIPKEKMNSGTPVYPKWFPMSTQCAAPKGKGNLGCRLDAEVTEDNSGANRFRSEFVWIDPKRSADPEHPTYKDNNEKSITSMDALINKKDGTVGAPNEETYDPVARADTLYDAETQLFWTWQGPHAIAETCKGVIDSGIGGQMIFAVGMDTTDLPHWDAWMNCVREWKQT
ncbi:hypothetical protein QFC22_004645 [Naganishia vaughanmartiniae]|uniref:Uncharacterized protein n=1 Tax=Naganishia vaughanmartiniae TaxID=1424756 RepID=A0ACC2X2K0_9TREE|nr:hypothetical protein QFC22_004645 [Naganishia vaughanmartiniae]